MHNAGVISIRVPRQVDARVGRGHGGRTALNQDTFGPEPGSACPRAGKQRRIGWRERSTGLEHHHPGSNTAPSAPGWPPDDVCEMVVVLASTSVRLVDAVSKALGPTRPRWLGWTTPRPGRRDLLALSQPQAQRRALSRRGRVPPASAMNLRNDTFCLPRCRAIRLTGTPTCACPRWSASQPR